MINRIILVGRITRDPELRKTTTDTPVTSFVLAVENRNRNADGQKTTSFIPVTVWNEQATKVCKYLHKGSLVSVDGRIFQKNYDKKDGTKASSLEVIADYVQFLEPKKDSYKNESNENDVVSTTNDSKKKNDVEENNSEQLTNDVDVSDDDLPF